MSGQRFVQFGPDVPRRALPPAFAACLPPDNDPSPACDAIVGDTAHGGYCSEAPYRTMGYCACVNNAIGCPMIAAAACANSAFAYRPTAMQAPAGQDYQSCKGVTICNNIANVYGSQNIVSGITQECGVITNLTNIVKTNPVFAALTFLLVVALAVLLATRPGRRAGRAPPPPPPGVLGVGPGASF